MSMKKKFNIGDRVMCTDNGALGVISSLDIDTIAVCDGYTVLFDDGEETWICADMVVYSDKPLYDPKAAFLLELKGLLEKYDAKMSADVSGLDLDCAEIDMLFLIGDDEIRFDVSMFNSFITPDNIIESACYEKE